MVAIYKAPELCQGSDESLIVQIGEIIFPGFVDRKPGENGLRLQLEGDYADISLIKIASDQFQILLGVLRAWNSLAGQRKDEVRPGIGSAPVMDKHGNQIVMVGTVIEYTASNSDRESYIQNSNIALQHSPNLRNVFWLNGRRDRNAADFYMMYEYAKEELGGRKGIVKALGISDNVLTKLTKSANNLAPTEGGRHAKGTGKTEWSVDDQTEFMSRFLKAWINYRAKCPV